MSSSERQEPTLPRRPVTASDVTGVGEVFGKYQLIGIISSGGMGELYLALQAGLEGFSKVVALKRMLPHLERSEDFVRMFLDEARLAARLDHQNIVRIYELGEHGGRYYTAMEYLPGEDLAKVIEMTVERDLAVDSDIVATIIQAAAEGLHFAHELTDADGRSLHLVHRDVSPQNIVVTYYGSVKLVDFGIAKAADNLSMTRAGTFKGKLGYVSPEQLVDAAAIDRRCDIFCLGIVMWEMLAGRRLFARESELATVLAVREDRIPSLASVRPDVDPMLGPIVMKALARDPLERYQTAEQLRADLETYLSARAWRPSTRDLSEWLESVFGADRAAAKQAIARGTNLRTAMSLVMKTLPSLERRATVPLGPPRASKSGAELRKTKATSALSRLTRAALGVATVALLAVGYWGWSGDEVEAPLAATLEIDSEPPDASIFLRGEPTGRKTPSTISGVVGGADIEIRLEKTGYTSARETITPQPGQTLVRKFTLAPAMGRVHFVNLRPESRLFIDGESAVPQEFISVPRGRHEFRFITKGGVIVHTVEVRDGVTTVRLR